MLRHFKFLQCGNRYKKFVHDRVVSRYSNCRTQRRSSTNTFLDNHRDNHAFRPPQWYHSNTPVILLPTMRERHVAFCGLNKRYKDPTPRPRYPTQRLAACNLVKMECLRMFWVSFLYSMSENLLERGWRTYNLGNGRSGTGTSKNSHNGSHPCLTLNYHKITWLEPISRYRKYIPQAISPSVRSPLSIDYVNYDSPSSACPVNTAP